MLEVAAAEDENPVEAVGADGAHLACSPVGRALDAVAADPLVLVPATDTVVVAASGSRCIRVVGAVVSAGAAASSAQLNSQRRWCRHGDRWADQPADQQNGGTAPDANCCQTKPGEALTSRRSVPAPRRSLSSTSSSHERHGDDHHQVPRVWRARAAGDESRGRASVDARLGLRRQRAGLVAPSRWPASSCSSRAQDGAPRGVVQRAVRFSPLVGEALHRAARASQRLAVRRAYTTARRRAGATATSTARGRSVRP
jgi:hypothetical protein